MDYGEYWIDLNSHGKFLHQKIDMGKYLLLKVIYLYYRTFIFD